VVPHGLESLFFAQFLKNKGHQVSINGAFSFKTINKFGISTWCGIKLYNLTPIIMVNNIISASLNILSSILISFFIIIFKRPDIIVISVPKGDTSLGTCFVAFALHKKIIIDYRDQWEDYLINNAKTKNFKCFYKKLKKHMNKFYMRSNHVITVTEPILQNLSNRGIKNVKLIENGADVNIFKPNNKSEIRKILGFKEHDFIFIYSGGMIEYYRLDLVIQAIQRLIQRKKNVKLLLVGSGPYLKKITELIKKNNLENYIIYLGEVIEKSSLAQIISSANVGIIPFDSNKLWDNALPSKALEYFSCSLPTVATVNPNSVLGKLIIENQIGLISKPEHVDSLSDSLEKICNDNLYVKKAEENARNLILERFDRTKIAQKFLNLIEE